MKLLRDREIYEEFTESYLTKAHQYVWIATANIKSTGLRFQRRFISFVDLVAILVNRGVSFRIIHAELPSGPFRQRYEALDSRGSLSAGVEFLHCIRMHAKIFIVDGKVALIGSANLTGAGIGAKGQQNRNFELAFFVEGEQEVRPFAEYFDSVWMGAHCTHCGRREICPGPAA
ncbi:MAG: phospholipase D family protein [Thermodesulfobacteriota bacterium]